MYEEYFGLRELPFNITPDPRFLFLSHAHREAYNHLFFGITERKGFILLTGEVGTGKTTLCRAILNDLDPRFKTAVVLNPWLTGSQLLRAILKELGLRAPRDRMGCLEILNEFLLGQVYAGNEVVVIIDEAQDLSLELLEQVRLLSNLETDQRKLLQIVLVGQPELRKKLDSPRLRQLCQRIVVRYHLVPLSADKTARYIEHRVRLAGGNSRPAFSPASVRRIYRYSHGVPRLINAVCDKLLLTGFASGNDRFAAADVRRAVRELQGVAL